MAFELIAAVKGTSAGFCATSPSGDPGGSSEITVDTYAWAMKDTAPVTSGTITEIGWWQNSGPAEDVNMEVGIYTHNVGDDNPEAIVGVSRTNAKGAGNGEWKKVTGLNIPITAGTIYWIAIQVDDTSTDTKMDFDEDAGEDGHRNSEATLPDPWGASGLEQTRLFGIYAVWEAAPSAGGQDGPYVY